MDHKLPDDILYLLFEQLDRASLFAVSLLSLQWNEWATPILYQSIRINHDQSPLPILRARRDLSARVRHILVDQVLGSTSASWQELKQVLELSEQVEGVTFEHVTNREVRDCLDSLIETGRASQLRFLSISASINNNSSSSRLTSAYFSSRLVKFPLLQHLTLGDIAIKRAQWTAPKYALESLTLFRSPMEEAQLLQFLGPSTIEKGSLEKLEMEEGQAFPYPTITSSLPRTWYTNLKHVILRQMRFDSDMQSFIEHLPHLQKLTLCKIQEYFTENVQRRLQLPACLEAVEEEIVGEGDSGIMSGSQAGPVGQWILNAPRKKELQGRVVYYRE